MGLPIFSLVPFRSLLGFYISNVALLFVDSSSVAVYGILTLKPLAMRRSYVTLRQ